MQPQQQQGGQASGPGGATGPVPNRGSEMAVLSTIAGLMQLTQMAASKLPVGSDAARDIYEGIAKIRKHLSSADMSEGVVSTGAKNLMMQQRQMGPQIAAMRAAQAGGGGQPQPQPPPQPQMAQ